MQFSALFLPHHQIPGYFLLPSLHTEPPKAQHPSASFPDKEGEQFMKAAQTQSTSPRQQQAPEQGLHLCPCHCSGCESIASLRESTHSSPNLISSRYIMSNPKPYKMNIEVFKNYFITQGRSFIVGFF